MTVNWQVSRHHILMESTDFDVCRPLWGRCRKAAERDSEFFIQYSLQFYKLHHILNYKVTIMMQYQEKINLFLQFWRDKAGTDTTLVNNNTMFGVDCFLDMHNGFRIALEVKTHLTVEDIRLFQTLQHVLSEYKCFLVILSDRITENTAHAFMDAKLNFFVSSDFAFLSLPGFTYVYYLREKSTTKRSELTEHTIFAGRGSRLCRILLSDRNRQWRQSELVQASGLNKGYVSILMKKMVDEQYVQQINYQYTVIDFNRFLDDWVRVYRFQRFKIKQHYAIAGRDYWECMKKTADILTVTKQPFAFTGWTAAALRAAYMEPPTVMAYVTELPSAMSELIPVPSNGNVFLAVPSDMGRLQQLQTHDGLPLVCDIQAYLDLSKMPGRAIDQAEYYRGKLLL